MNVKKEISLEDYSINVQDLQRSVSEAFATVLFLKYCAKYETDDETKGLILNEKEAELIDEVYDYLSTCLASISSLNSIFEVFLRLSPPEEFKPLDELEID